MKKIKIVLDDGAIMPKKAHNTDAGYDLYYPNGNPGLLIRKHSSQTIDTGVHIEIPEGYVGMIKSKSGLNVNFGILSEGVIDCGYTGSIRVKLYNHSDEDIVIGECAKISQLVIMPILTGEDFEVVDSLTPTDRGNNGFGSTGEF